MSDLEQIDALIAEFFECFDNREGRVPCAAAMAGMFTSTAAISQHKQGTLELYSPAEFAAPRVALLTHGTLRGFREWELDATTRVLGPLATRLSTYAKAGCLDGVDFTGKGTKIFQLVKLHRQWRILALSWFDSADQDTNAR